MAKLVFKERVVRQIREISPIAGCEIVVYKKSGDKFTLYKHLREDDRLQEEERSFLARFLNPETSSYVGFAVDMSAHLRLEYSKMFSSDEFNNFDLEYMIEYRVIDSQRLVSRVIGADEDALERLKDVIGDHIKDFLKYKNPEHIRSLDIFRDYTRDLAEVASEKERPKEEHRRKLWEMYEAINRRLAEVGLKVNRINLDRRLSQAELDWERDRRKKEEIHRLELERRRKEEELRRLEREYEGAAGADRLRYEFEIERLRSELDAFQTRYARGKELDDEHHKNEKERIKLLGQLANLEDLGKLDNYEQRKQLKETIMSAFGTSINEIATNIKNPAQLSEAVNKVVSILMQLQTVDNNYSLNGQAGPNEISAGSVKGFFGAANDKPLNEAVKIFSEILEILQEAGIPSDTTKLIMSKVLHLLGELILSDDADKEVIELYLKQTYDQFKLIRKKLSSDHSERLKYLTNFEELIRRFK